MYKSTKCDTIVYDMKVTELTITNYRNLAAQKVTFDKGLNVFVGDNAQGKTNLVESVYLCCIGKSPRVDRDKDLVRWGEQSAYVKLRYNSRYGDGEIAVKLNTVGKKQIAVGGAPLTKTADLLGNLNCVYFSPNEIRIISSSPAERRRFLDIDLCQTDKNYFYSLARFNKALLQRNNLLKSAATIDEARETVFVWDKQIAEEGAQVIAKRRRFCDKLKDYARRCHEKLTDGKETLLVAYVTPIEGETVADIASDYLAKLQANLERDFAARHTTTGCQRDDIVLRVNDVDVRNFGSQGQQRTTALALKLGELMFFKDIIGEYPVLLLDDVLSELDVERQRRLLTFDSKLQILLTTATELPPEIVGIPYVKYRITNGLVTK